MSGGVGNPDNRGVTDIKRQEYEKGGTGQPCHKLLRGQGRRKSDRGLGRVTDDLNNGAGVGEGQIFGVGRSQSTCPNCFREEAVCPVTPASWPQVRGTGVDSLPKLSQLD